MIFMDMLLKVPNSFISLYWEFLFASMSCEYVTAYWMIFLQLLLHPLSMNMLLLIG